ncbi:hypothetical protein J7W19_10775 [Streptomyces mobaraensis NBRC 13819 = DSM 40847]|uniref:Uncharacterized protein n=1 Tax=Streptomyces mobaraensis (strain ATCC 29032 / DSM 40847 / JCM 4168 / NBRC 13819 / NCIMB 11159 / IPCR 16-22) TaxID=1223523 RepID=M3C1B5_STRM1|nr:hypothetical protein [Streptomyces mobaraensis]EME97746.1 hypothetical protein H340_24942 [Streptomyces mobaraensis NBRC 13819 = DSM 40847]QTT73840.1 hypothetical protein J7W19_10775 [Streptomyces mobaraensis NBRC 13819 = DSM 40847]
MTYNFLTADRLSPEVIRKALSECLAVETNNVDVADAEGEQDGRNWDALILCDYSSIRGQLSLSLDIYVQDSVVGRPTESELALEFAAATQTTVLYPADEDIPSAYWAAVPNLKTTRVRLTATDDERPTYSIDAAESEIPQFPDVQVSLLPEVIREHPMTTPVTDSFLTKAESIRSFENQDKQPLESDVADDHLDRARCSLASWERMIRRMAAGWPPSGEYPLDMYVNDLRARDDLATLLSTCPDPCRHFLRESVDLIDAEFKRLTEPDLDRLITLSAGESQDDSVESSWWWHQKPPTLPWSRF